MDKTIKIVPLANIEYEGKKYTNGSEPFDMKEETAIHLIEQGIVKVAVEAAKSKNIKSEE